ncbi:MAG: RNA polymerase-associated protein RapA [Chroococcidiopsis cubana SAG 39.79]|uniref:DEAD/DEAH box helicase n=2 Tax=Chroococcidiopsis cubana TaxID=171392 RepID=UPI002AC62735|nr:DEAD/DEAH box helicase [Chroococcidiopsis cubana]MDZ4875292.1 RNA polymerase-associated protein RapA [Chroococcidiopsis cubana SAG 39.79]
MAILHCNWIQKDQQSYLFIWGEVWRSLVGDIEIDSATDVPTHPLTMTAHELLEWWRASDISIPKSLSLSEQKQGRSQKNSESSPIDLPILNQTLALPSIETQKQKKISIRPLYSAPITEENDERETTKSQFFYPWQVEGFYLEPQEAIAFLTSLPLAVDRPENSWMGGDLRFWSQVARWSLDLLSRGKFVPTLSQQSNDINNCVIARWRSLLDSAIDSSRLAKFAQAMPAVCCFYQNTTIIGAHGCAPLQIKFPSSPQELILEFLNDTIDVQVRAIAQQNAQNNSFPTVPSPLKEWLQSLAAVDAKIIADPAQLERLEAMVKAWTAPIQYQLEGRSLFRTCFQLSPPTEGKNNWSLSYYLQAVDTPEFIVDAATIWQHPVANLEYCDAEGGSRSDQRTISQPQETLLRGLGLASRLYSLIAPSLEQPFPQSCSLNPLQAYEFIKSVVWRFEDSGLGVILPSSLEREGWANRLGLKISATTPKKSDRLGLQSLLNFKWELAIGGQTLSKAEFDRLVKLNSPLVEINGEWVELRPQDIKTAQAFFTARKDNLNLSLEDALRLSTGDTQTIEKLPVVSFEASGALQELMTALTDNQAIAPLATPEGFRGELRPYQARGAGWLSFLERWGLGACLADDMGLGKTIQFIAFLLNLKQQKALEKPTLLVCPTSVLGNWEREVRKFAPQLKVLMYHGDKRPKGKTFEQTVTGKDLVITSYALMHRDLKTHQSVSWQGIVLDEAQNIKNSEAKQSQAVRQLEAQFRFALTGTPVENRLQELWSILDFINPGYLGQKQFFQRRFAIPIEKYGDAASLKTLRSLVQPFILRRLKSDRSIIQDLPEKQEMTEFCGLSPEQAKLYEQLVETSLAEIDAADGIQRRGMILALLVKLKQLCNHPGQFLKETTLKEPQRSGKLIRLQEMLEEAISEGDRALIFTQFAEWGKLLKPHLEQKLGREIFFLYGSTSKKQREEMIDRFQHDPQGPPVMILSLKAGGTGLNLTRANHVFHFDRWWNPAVENQATDRVFRIGQTRNVQVHKFVCTGTLEEKINDMIESKKALAEQVVGAGENWLTDLDTDQLRQLLVLERNAVIEENED